MDENYKIELILNDEDIHFFVYRIKEVGGYNFEYYLLSFRYIYQSNKYKSDIDGIFHKEVMNELIQKYKL